MDRQLDKLFTQFINVAPFPPSLPVSRFSHPLFLSSLETLLSSPCVLAILNQLPKIPSVTNFLFQIEITE